MAGPVAEDFSGPVGPAHDRGGGRTAHHQPRSSHHALIIAGISIAGVAADMITQQHGAAGDQQPEQHRGGVAHHRAHRLCGRAGHGSHRVGHRHTQLRTRPVGSRGKTGVLVAFAAAMLIGGANVLVDFFVTAGKGL